MDCFQWNNGLVNLGEVRSSSIYKVSQLVLFVCQIEIFHAFGTVVKMQNFAAKRTLLYSKGYVHIQTTKIHGTMLVVHVRDLFMRTQKVSYVNVVTIFCMLKLVRLQVLNQMQHKVAKCDKWFNMKAFVAIEGCEYVSK